MGKGRFVNQKLGKRISHRGALLKNQLACQHAGKAQIPQSQRLPKKGVSREEKPLG